MGRLPLNFYLLSRSVGRWEGGTIEHTNSQTDVLLGSFVTVDGGQEVLKSSKIFLDIEGCLNV